MSAIADAEILWTSAHAANEEILQAHRANAVLGNAIPTNRYGMGSAAFDDSVLDAVIAVTDKENIVAEAILDKDVLVMSPTLEGVAEASGISDAHEAIDFAFSILMGAEAVVAAVDGGNVFKTTIARGAVNIETVIVNMGGGHIAHDDMRVLTAEL